MYSAKEECCSEFHPEEWNDKEFVWKDKLFLKTHVRSVFHIPLNFGSVMTRAMSLIEAADAKPEAPIVISDECSLWRSDVYIEVTKDVPNAQMATLSGTFVAKVFEGPYSQMGKWIREAQSFVKEQGKPALKLLFYYTTCPKCAKKYGKNYVVVLVQTG